MRDLLIIVPSRGRPAQAQRLAAAVTATCRGRTDLLFCVDDDDSCLPSYRDLAAQDRWVVYGPRQSLGAWTNKAAAAFGVGYLALASLGDDHLPRTGGWDLALLAAAGKAGIAYGDDLLQRDALPTAPVITANIVQALGWMCPPVLGHYWIDNAWRDLGEQAGCLAYVPSVVIEHLHPAAGKTPTDPTYDEAAAAMAADQQAYQAWRAGQLAAAAAAVRALL